MLGDTAAEAASANTSKILSQVMFGDPSLAFGSCDVLVALAHVVESLFAVR